MKKVLLNKEVSKDILQAIGYFVLIAGILRLSIPQVQASSFLAQLAFVVIFLAITSFVTFYVYIHVARPIVQLYHPDFTLPEIDPNHNGDKNWLSVIFSKSFFFYLVLMSITSLIGWFIVGLAFTTQS